MEESRQFYERSVALDPNIFQTLCGWAQMEETARNFDRARELLDAAEKLSPGNPHLDLLSAWSPLRLAAASLDLVIGVDSGSTPAQIADGFWTDRPRGLSASVRDAAGRLRHDLPHPQSAQTGCHDGCGSTI
jgi:hypothetical protein